MPETDMPIVRPSEFPGEDEHSPATIRGILLAAGTSSRYGEQNKLLQTVSGTPMVRLVAETLLESTVDGVTVVVGHEDDRVTAAVADLDVSIRINDQYATGQSTSVRTGISEATNQDADAALIALGDMPWVNTATIDHLAEAYRLGVGEILVATYDGNRGNPVLFGRRFFDALMEVEGDVGGRTLLFESDETAGIETGDPGVLRDIDRPEDLPE